MQFCTPLEVAPEVGLIRALPSPLRGCPAGSLSQPPPAASARTYDQSVNPDSVGTRVHLSRQAGTELLGLPE